MPRARTTPLTGEQLQAKIKRDFSKLVRETFTQSGFLHLKTDGIEKTIGARTFELDNIFLYENILLIAEETTHKTSNIKDHLRKKDEAFREIMTHKSEFFEWMKSDFMTQFDQFQNSYINDRYIIKHLYFTLNPHDLTIDEIRLYGNTIIIESAKLKYFNKMATSIKLSNKYEIFKFLDIDHRDVGQRRRQSSADIELPIIHPKEYTGLTDGIRVVSFMLSAETLLKNSYVLRKDGWNNNTQLYQRLIEKKRIKEIRKFVADNGTSFYNNIIVSLPKDTRFKDLDGNFVEINNILDEGNYIMVLPDRFNSIGIIDGQHRVFAHYEDTDSLERIIAPLRSQLHLLTTGFIYPQSKSDAEIFTHESKVFRDINTKSKPVPSDVLLFIEQTMDPFSSYSIARQALIMMNKFNTFMNLFELSSIETALIKTPSIIKFALKSIVAVNDLDNKASLFYYWTGDKTKIANKDLSELSVYVEFVARFLNMYFSCLKTAKNDIWNEAINPEVLDDERPKILSVTSINGFIIALRKILPDYGLQEARFYIERFQHLTTDFTRLGFPYASSQYAMYSTAIVQEIFPEIIV